MQHGLWRVLLIELAKAVEDAGGCLPPDEAKRWRRRYRRLLKKAETECPPPDEGQRKGKRGRLKRSKARNLLVLSPEQTRGYLPLNSDNKSIIPHCKNAND